MLEVGEDDFFYSKQRFFLYFETQSVTDTAYCFHTLLRGEIPYLVFQFHLTVYQFHIICVYEKKVVTLQKIINNFL